MGAGIPILKPGLPRRPASNQRRQRRVLNIGNENKTEVGNRTKVQTVSGVVYLARAVLWSYGMVWYI